jgi:hypothetical protein
VQSSSVVSSLLRVVSTLTLLFTLTLSFLSSGDDVDVCTGRWVSSILISLALPVVVVVEVVVSMFSSRLKIIIHFYYLSFITYLFNRVEASDCC